MQTRRQHETFQVVLVPTRNLLPAARRMPRHAILVRAAPRRAAIAWLRWFNRAEALRPYGVRAELRPYRTYIKPANGPW